MKKILFSLLLVVALAPAIKAADYVTYESLSVGATAVGITSTVITPDGRGQQDACAARLEDGQVRYRYDGTDPTATEGVLLEPGSVLQFPTTEDAKRVKFIRTTSTSGVLKVTCWRNGAGAVPSVSGTVWARTDHPNRFRCTVTVSTATTIQAVGGSCAAPGAGLSLYITDILFASNAQAIAADAFPTLKYGTGGTCGTGTTVFWGAFAAAATQASIVQHLATPIKIPANNEICWINSTAGSKFLVIVGFIAP